MNNRFEYQSRLKPEFVALDNAIIAGDVPAFQRSMQDRKDLGYQTVITTSGETLLEVAIIHGKSTIVKCLLNNELKIEHCSQGLSNVLNHYIEKSNTEEQYKIALNLICCGAETRELTRRLDLEDKLFQFVELMKESNNCQEKIARSNFEIKIGLELEKAGLTKEALEYYRRAADNGNALGMYHLANLLRQNKNYLEAAKHLLESAQHYKGRQQDQNNILYVFKAMIEASDDEQEQTQLLSALSEAYQLFGENEKLKMVQVRIANSKAAFEASKLLNTMEQFTYGDIVNSEDKEQKGAVSPLHNNYFYKKTSVRARAANLGCEKAYDELVAHAMNKDNKIILETQIMSCHFVLSSPFASNEIKSHCQKILEKYSGLYQGLCHLFGLNNTPAHVAKAIRLFEEFSKSHDQQGKEAIETANIYQIQAEVCRVMDEPNPEKRMQFFTQIEDKLKSIPYATAPIGNAIIFKFLFDLVLKVSEAAQIKLLDLIIERYQKYLHKWTPNDLYGTVPNKILSYKLIEKNEKLLNKLIKGFIKGHKEAKEETNKSFALSQLQVIEKHSNDPKFQFNVKLALAECYASYTDPVNLEKAVKYYEALLPLQAAAKENVRMAHLRDLYKRYGDSAKGSDKQAAYHKAAKLGDVTVLKSLAADEKSIPEVIEYFKCAFSKATKKNIQDIVTHFFSVTKECALLESDYLQQLVLSVYRNFGDVLSFSELEKARLPFSAAKVNNDLKIASLFANKSTEKAIKAGVSYFLEQKDQKNQEAIFYHFKKFLISSLSKKFNISDFDVLFEKDERLASLQNDLFPFLKENIFIFVGSLDKEDGRYQNNLYLLHRLLGRICKNKEYADLDNELKLVEVIKMMLDLDSIAKDHKDALISNLKSIILQTKISQVQEKALVLILEKQPDFFKTETNKQLLMHGFKLNNVDAVYRLSKLYEAEKKDLDATLYLKAKFIILSFKDKNYSQSAQNALNFLREIAKAAHHDLAIVANFYLQVINDLRAFNQDKNSDIDAIMLNAIEALDLSQVKSKITKGMQTFVPIAASQKIIRPVTSLPIHIDVAARPLAYNPEAKVDAPVYPSILKTVRYSPPGTLPNAPSFEVVEEPVIKSGGPLIGQGTRFIPLEIKEHEVIPAPSKETSVVASKSAQEQLEQALRELPPPPISSLRKHSLMKPQIESDKQGQENQSQPGQVVLGS